MVWLERIKGPTHGSENCYSIDLRRAHYPSSPRFSRACCKVKPWYNRVVISAH